MRFLENWPPGGWSGTDIHEWCERTHDGSSWPASVQVIHQSARKCESTQSENASDDKVASASEGSGDPEGTAGGGQGDEPSGEDKEREDDEGGDTKPDEDQSEDASDNKETSASEDSVDLEGTAAGAQGDEPSVEDKEREGDESGDVEPDENSGGSSRPTIIASAIGALGAVVAACVGGVFVYRRKSQN